MLLISAICSLSTYSTNIKFLQTIPENGSDITTFDIKLKFDISEAIAESGNENIAIGYSGNTRTSNAKLYDGNAETGTLLTTVLTKTYRGDTNSKDIIDLSIPSSFVPEAGHTYTVVFANNVAMYDLATNLSVANSVINYSSSPLTFTFHGESASADVLIYQKASVTNNDNIESLNSISFEFNEDLLISHNKPIEIYNGQDIIASSTSIEIDPANSKALKAIFEDVNMYLGKQYAIKLPEGVVCLKSNPSVVNQPIEIIVNGASTIRVSTKSVSIENNSVVLPDNLTIKFNLEDGLTLTPPGPFDHKKDIDFYKGEISSGNLIETLEGTANGDGITWDLSTFRFEPETMYCFYKKSDDITVWENGIRQAAFGNDEIIISFSTPSPEDAGFTPMEFSPSIVYTSVDKTSNNVYDNDMEVSNIHTIVLNLKDELYYLGTRKCYLTVHPDKTNCELIEVNNDGEKLLKTFDFNINLVETATGFYNEAFSEIQSILYEGKTYKVRIPEGYFTVYPVIVALDEQMDLSKCNYIKSKEIEMIFKGTSPTNAVLLGCNIENNAQKSALYKVIWTFDGEYRISNDITSIIQVRETGIEGMKPVSNKKEPSLIYSSGKTYLTLDYISNLTGEPTSLPKGQKLTLTIPEGMLINVLNDEIVNDEVVLTVIGGEETLPSVDVNLTINDLHTASHKAVKGEKYSFTVAPNNDWKVESVMHGDKVLSGKNGVYTTEPLNENAEIKANLTYAGQLATEITTDVWEITDKHISIYRDNDHIVVDGVTSANTINVYSVSGLLITSIHTTDGNDRVNITVPSGQMYIVSVDGVAAKIQM